MKRALLVILALLWMFGCNSSQKGMNKVSNARRSGKDVVTGKGFGDTRVLASWCEKAVKIKTVTDHLQHNIKFLCAGNQPTPIFKSDLPRRVYTLESYNKKRNPYVEVLEDFKHSGNRTEVVMGMAVKLPISIKQHFEVVGPQAGDPTAQEAIIKEQGAAGEVKVLKELPGSDRGYRGWHIYSSQTKKVSGISINIQSSSIVEQYRFEDGKSYMYTQYIDHSADGDGEPSIFETSVLTAGIDVGGIGYLINVTFVAANNHGVAQKATQEIAKTAKGTMRSMFKMSLAAKSKAPLDSNKSQMNSPVGKSGTNSSNHSSNGKTSQQDETNDDEDDSGSDEDDYEDDDEYDDDENDAWDE